LLFGVLSLDDGALKAIAKARPEKTIFRDFVI
jgi:hypothetical protein